MVRKTSYSKKFSTAFKSLICFEGEYSNDNLDHGGETKFGICKRSYPDLDIKNLTLDEAKKIYYNDYWNGYGYDQIKSILVSSKVFNITVNTGPRQSHKILQRALRATGLNNLDEDGIFGPKTLEATNTANPKALVAALRSENAGFYRILVANQPSQNKFIKGWMKRAYN